MEYSDSKHYKITKLGAHEPDKFSKIPKDYWAIGILDAEPEIDNVLFMWRLANKSNSDGKFGYFKTSKIKEIDKRKFHWDIKTLNSIYRLEEYHAEKD